MGKKIAETHKMFFAVFVITTTPKAERGKPTLGCLGLCTLLYAKTSKSGSLNKTILDILEHTYCRAVRTQISKA